MKITDAGRSSRTVPLSLLKLGDTFIFDSRIGMVASRNGHVFPLELATGHEFWIENPARPWVPHDAPAMLSPQTEVELVDCELIFKVRS
jgi:hypothetical protein